ncbi:hypothetical protein Q9Q94_10410 [Uliginosibacterium sp. 31-16]|uniref:hypothetical protein n=1 Tax=Uliginosibacterium sp. 31-16 TaxID=3068315 RepID=UPI00273FA0A1|nr:hypothetical protein [Uliginosibacterium sp. 31-16]MDP5239948.1 hypothetical protein [Uliginosibacterium sp. 31-16]
MSFHPSMGPRAQPRLARRATCVLPGLVWPGHGITATLHELKLPGLAAILGHGRLQQQAGEPYTNWLAHQFGAKELPWGALRWEGEAEGAATGREQPFASRETPYASILCADPVSLAFTSTSLILRGPRELALQADEVAALIDALNTEFAHIGEFRAASPEHWYLHLREPVSTRFHPLSDVLGRPVELFQPEGEKARDWARLANEIQVMLYNHPLNRLRGELGQLTANALWFWGQGNSAPTLHRPAGTLIGDDPMLRGLAAATGATWFSSDAADSPACGQAGHSWWHDTRLQDAALAGDFMGWLEGLQELDAELLQPLWQAWCAGRLHEIRLQAPSDKAFLGATLKTRSRWAFWRGPLANDRLAPLLQASGIQPETTA